jgi:hypothetical protein
MAMPIQSVGYKAQYFSWPVSVGCSITYLAQISSTRCNRLLLSAYNFVELTVTASFLPICLLSWPSLQYICTAVAGSALSHYTAPALRPTPCDAALSDTLQRSSVPAQLDVTVSETFRTRPPTSIPYLPPLFLLSPPTSSLPPEIVLLSTSCFGPNSFEFIWLRNFLCCWAALLYSALDRVLYNY